MKLLKISAVAAATCLLATSVSADEAKPKRQLKNNMMVVTNIAPKSVDTLSEMFTEGIFYGRLRMNSFKWDWRNEKAGSTQDNKAFGLGGSLAYKSAAYNGLSAQAGLYFTSSPFSSLRQGEADLKYSKSGKDTFSRYQVDGGGAWEYAVLAEANLQYKISNTTATAGRQIFESFLTKSNDTKMIPNTFEGLVIEMNEIPKTKIRGAYFTAQKLRDHTTFHDVITIKDVAGSSWNNNDDSAVHKGLSYANFTAAGADVNHELIVVDMRNNSIDNLQVDVTYGSVPNVISSLTGELNYKIGLSSGYSLTPGVRYMQQMDNGGGAIGGASLSGNVTAANGAASGYNDGGSLDGSLAMARLVLKNGPLKAQIAYSAVSDNADIVAPWRGFPTGGYTRAMAQYNWRANTKTTAAEVHYDFDKAGLVSGFSAMARYAIQDFDEAKQGTGGVQADSKILHVDLRENITKDLYAKVRVGLVSADSRVGGIDQDSYNEYRFELNYLF